MRCAWGNGSSPSLLPIANFCVTHTLTHWHTRHTLTQTQTHLRGRWCVIAWAKVNRSHLLCCSIAWAIWEAHRQAFFASCLFDWLTDKGMDKVEVGYGVWRGETLWLGDWRTDSAAELWIEASLHVSMCGDFPFGFWQQTPRPPYFNPPPTIVGLTNAWDNYVAKNVDSLRICRFLLSIHIAGCEKREEYTFSLLASFFLYFSFAFWATLLTICGRGSGSNTQRFFLHSVWLHRQRSRTEIRRVSCSQLFGLLSFFFRLFKY